MNPIADSFFSCVAGSEEPATLPVLDAAKLTGHEFKKEWVDKNQACLIKGAVKHWPVSQKCTNKEYWLTTFDNFGLSVYPHHNHNDNKAHEEGRMQMNFHDAIERLFANEDPVVSMPSQVIINTKGQFTKKFRPFKDDLGEFPFLPSPPLPRNYPQLRCFLYRGAATAWHWHKVDETLMCQVSGSKRVGLLDPQVRHPKMVSKFLTSESYLSGEKLDPALKAKLYMATVEESDALYIPPYWFHGVVPTDDKIGLTAAFCWRSPIHIFGNFSNYFVRDLYRKMYRPVTSWSFIAPFMGIYAGTSYAIKKLLGQI